MKKIREVYLNIFINEKQLFIINKFYEIRNTRIDGTYWYESDVRAWNILFDNFYQTENLYFEIA
jgi:hypothetical protein